MTATLLIEHPPGYEPERRYIFDVLLGEFLGLSYQTQVGEGTDVRITLAGDQDDRCLTLPDVLFQTAQADWLAPQSLPATPLPWWEVPAAWGELPLVARRLPVLYGRRLPGGDYLAERDGSIVLGLDLFGGAFVLLSRYEEVVLPVWDEHDRFPASASLARHEGFLDRPVVDEYLEVLWASLTRLWPRLQRRPRRHRVFLSHDVDWPLAVLGRPRIQVLRSIAGDLVKRRTPATALRRLASQVRVEFGRPVADPYDTFDFLMDLGERHGLPSAYYFIAGHSAGDIDGVYTLDDPWIRDLLRRIHARGHEIGLHPSYRTYRDPARTRQEWRTLRRVTDELDIRQETWGGRQHYLRWENPTTWQIWEDLGLDYDTTLSFADYAGFRCGTCHAYPVFNLHTRQMLRLRERPLIVMEATLLFYMRLSWERSLETIRQLNDACRRVSGDFTLLWHNNNLATPESRRWYRRVIEEIA